MTKAEFDRIVNEAVNAGANRTEAEQHVIRGFHLETNKAGKPVFDGEAARKPRSRTRSKK